MKNTKSAAENNTHCLFGGACCFLREIRFFEKGRQKARIYGSAVLCLYLKLCGVSRRESGNIFSVDLQFIRRILLHKERII